jgi:hypothetical protein
MFRLSLFRRLARPIAVLVLLAGPAGLLHTGLDDRACIAAGEPDDGIARLGAARGHSSDHCLVCHWTSSLRSPSLSVARAHAVLVVGAGIDVSPPIARRAPALDRLPARAPPRTL